MGVKELSGRWPWFAPQMNRLFLSYKPAMLVAKRYVWLGADEYCHFCQVFFCFGLRTLPDVTACSIASGTGVSIDSVQKKPACGACRGGGSFVFPRSVRSNETEQGRSWLSAKSQDLPHEWLSFDSQSYRTVRAAQFIVGSACRGLRI